MKKIDWSKMWEKWDVWNSCKEGGRNPIAQRKKIQSLVEAQLKPKRKRK